MLPIAASPAMKQNPSNPAITKNQKSAFVDPAAGRDGVVGGGNGIVGAPGGGATARTTDTGVRGAGGGVTGLTTETG